MHDSDPLRQDAREWLRRVRRVDILVGIPSYQSGDTVRHVVEAAGEGLRRHFPELKGAILVSDGGSVDDARENALAADLRDGVKRHVTIYRGIPGKGAALRAVFEAARALRVRACAVFDSDLRSITPAWIRNALVPILDRNYDYVTPLYRRFKLDGSITNNLAYPLTRCLFGHRIRQPIGGDFGFSPRMIERFLSEEEDLWGSFVGRFGIDIWMTTRALRYGARICQARLGAKLHDPKDPSSLGGMFRDVVATLMTVADRVPDQWMHVEGSRAVPTMGREAKTAPAGFEIRRRFLLNSFVEGLEDFGPLWRTILGDRTVSKLREIPRRSPAVFQLPIPLWTKIVLDFTLSFHYWEVHRLKIVDLMQPLYHGQVLSFANLVENLSDEAVEEKVEELASTFEQEKTYLIRRWGTKKPSGKLGKFQAD